MADRSNGSAPIVVVRDVHKSFGDVHALAGVSLEIERGTVLGLLGPNGAGKTTLVRVLTTLLDPDEGSATVAGFDVRRDKTKVRPLIGLAGQSAAVDDTLTGRENLEMVANLYHMGRASAAARAGELLARFDLVEAAERQARTYSGGMRRRLDLAASLVADPEVLFLDEPTTGLDPQARLDLWAVIRELVATGTTVLLTTQYLEEADQLADEIVVIDHGRIIAQGTAADLKARSGGEHLTVRVSDLAALEEVRQVLEAEGDGPPTVDDATGTVSVAVSNGPARLAGVVRRLDEAEVAIADIGLRQPTLDEVFLSLTGHRAANETADATTGAA
ncbi:MAG: ATP-binding cassette domain-containing protein [Chloroflexi bacterium]|nr:ATP-binding cassette domain-containing protein [Chloroflexota bacterium]